MSTDPSTHDQLEVEWSPVPLHLPQGLEEGVLRLADEDLWLRFVLRHGSQTSADHSGRLGRVVLDRSGGDPGPALSAVDRLGSRARAVGRRVLAEAVAQPLAG